MKKEVVIKADKVRKRERFLKLAKVALLLLLLFLIVLYIILQIIYSEGKFTITLDPNVDLESGLVIYATEADERTGRRKLEADKIEFLDNISGKWIPANIHEEAVGSHNGDNYIAYTFFVENRGKETLNYWYEIIVEDVIKNVDEAIRIMIFHNDEKTVYAKMNQYNKQPEVGTTAFLENEDGTIILKQREDFEPHDVDRFTLVVWLEGDDPECVDSILGGEIKMHMNITEEHISQKRK